MIDQPHYQWLVTRPEPDNQAVCDALSQAGHLAIGLPTLAREPVPTATLVTNQPNLSTYDGVICISPTAAKLGAGLLKEHQPQHLAHPKWLAVGRATAQVLTSLDIHCVVPEQETSEGLLHLKELQQVNHQHWLIIRGNQGRQLLSKQLHSRQAYLDEWCVYQRVQPKIPNKALIEALNPKSPVMTGIIITSYTSLKNLMRSFKRIQSEMPEIVSHIQLTDYLLLTSSQRLTQLSIKHGFEQVHTANSVHIPDLLAAIATITHTD